MTISLIKIAVSYEDAMAIVANGKGELKGRIWQLLGRDPGEITPEIFAKYVDRVRETIPGDIPADMAGAAVFLARRHTLQTISEFKQLPDGKQVIGWDDDRLLIRDDIEDFGHLRDLVRAYNLRNSEKISADLGTYKTESQLERAVSALHEFKLELDRERYGEEFRKGLREKATEATSVIHGIPVHDLAHTGGDDLVNGHVDPAEWTIVVPKSTEASIYWGHGTDWCTARPDLEHNYHNRYSSDGDLYVLTNNRTGNRYQFHYQSRQFMNSDDQPIDNLRLLADLNNLIKQYIKVSPDEDPIEEKFHAVLTGGTFLSKRDQRGLILGQTVNGKIAPSIYKKQENELRWIDELNLSRQGGPAIVKDTSILYYIDGEMVGSGPLGTAMISFKTDEEVVDFVGLLVTKYGPNTVYFQYSEDRGPVAGTEIRLDIPTGSIYTSREFGVDHRTLIRPSDPQFAEISKYVKTHYARFLKALEEGRQIVASEQARWLPWVQSMEKTSAVGFSLIKTAISYEAALATLKPGDLRGRIWQAIGHDPGEMDGDDPLYQDLLETIKTCVPIDVPQKLRGPATLFVKREVLKNLEATSTSAGIELGHVDLFRYRRAIEDFGRLQEFVPLYNRQFGQNIQDILSIGGLRALEDLIFYLESYENEQLDKTHGKDYAKGLEPEAMRTTTILHGQPEKTQFKKNDKKLTEKDEEADLVDGLVIPSEWTIVRPDSVSASRYWGHNTDWCTAHPKDTHNYYHYYTKGENNPGPLFIFINNRTGHRYQFHFESNQFMNANDARVTEPLLLAGLGALLVSTGSTDLHAEDILTPASRSKLNGTLKKLIEPKNHLYTSEDGRPSMMSFDTLIWTKNSVPHREDGPAILNTGSARMEFFINGKESQEMYGLTFWSRHNVRNSAFSYWPGRERLEYFSNGKNYTLTDAPGATVAKVTSTGDRISLPNSQTEDIRRDLELGQELWKKGLDIYQKEVKKWGHLMNKEAAPKFTLIKNDNIVEDGMPTDNDLSALHAKTVREHALAQRAAHQLAEMYGPATLKALVGSHDHIAICDGSELTVPGLKIAEEALDLITDAFVPMEIPSGADLKQTEKYDPQLMHRVKGLLENGFWTDAPAGAIQPGAEIFVYDTEIFYKELFLDLDAVLQKQLKQICTKSAPAPKLRLVKTE